MWNGQWQKDTLQVLMLTFMGSTHDTDSHILCNIILDGGPTGLPPYVLQHPGLSCQAGIMCPLKHLRSKIGRDILYPTWETRVRRFDLFGCLNVVQ